MYVVGDASADHSSTRHLDNALLNSNTNIVSSFIDRPVQTTAVGNGEGGTHELRPSEDNLPRGINLGSSAQITPCQLETFGINSSSHRSIPHAKANGFVQATDPMIELVNGVAGIDPPFRVIKLRNRGSVHPVIILYYGIKISLIAKHYSLMQLEDMLRTGIRTLFSPGNQITTTQHKPDCHTGTII